MGPMGSMVYNLRGSQDASDHPARNAAAPHGSAFSERPRLRDMPRGSEERRPGQDLVGSLQGPEHGQNRTGSSG